MPFPQLPSAEEIGSTIKSTFKVGVALVALLAAYGLYSEITNPQEFVSPRDKFMKCVSEQVSADSPDQLKEMIMTKCYDTQSDL